MDRNAKSALLFLSVITETRAWGMSYIPRHIKSLSLSQLWPWLLHLWRCFRRRFHDYIWESYVRKGIRKHCLVEWARQSHGLIEEWEVDHKAFRFCAFDSDSTYLGEICSTEKALMDRDRFSSVSSLAFPLQTILPATHTKVRTHVRDTWCSESKNNAQDLLPLFFTQAHRLVLLPHPLLIVMLVHSKSLLGALGTNLG